MDRHGVGLESFILVGLGHAQGECGVASRNGDYTPTDRSQDRRPLVLEGEDHATVFPRLVTQGLMWALPKKD